MRIHLVSSDLDVRSGPGEPGWSGRTRAVRAVSGGLAGAGHDVAVVCPLLGDGSRTDPGVVHVPGSEPLRESLEKLWSTGSPDVVHALDRDAGLAAAAAGAVLVQSLPTVTGRTEQDVLLLRAERVVADSESQVDQLLRRGCPRSRLRVVPPGVDVGEWQPDGESLRRGPAARVVAVGSLDPDGGVDDAVAALRYAPDAELYVAGGPAPGVTKDPDLLRLQELAARSGVTRRVRFVGAVDDRNVARLLRSADVVVCPSRRGPCGTSVLEAMACARPVVATAVGCQKDMVVDGVTGVQVRPGQPIELGTTMRAVLADPTTCQAYGIAGRDRVLARYDRNRIVQAQLAVYEEVVPTAAPVTA